MTEDMDLTVGYISQVERGVTKLSLNTLANITDYLKCSIAESFAKLSPANEKVYWK